jgi:hypothetical protein
MFSTGHKTRGGERDACSESEQKRRESSIEHEVRRGAVRGVNMRQGEENQKSCSKPLKVSPEKADAVGFQTRDCRIKKEYKKPPIGAFCSSLREVEQNKV